MEKSMSEERDLWVAAAVFIVMLVILVGVIGVRILQQPTPKADTRSSQESTIANEGTVEAQVIGVINAGPSQGAPQLELQILSGPLRGERAHVDLNAPEYAGNSQQYHEGDHVLADVVTRNNGKLTLMVTDYVRTGSLAFLVTLFIGATVLVSGWKGFRSLLGLAISFVVLMGFVIPRILAGQDAVLVSATGAFVLLAATLYLSLGWSSKTHTALLGVVFTLILIGALSSFAVDLTRLTGAGSEDAITVQATASSIDLRGLFLAGIIIGSLGVLADVVVTQASAVSELIEANPLLNWRELYRRAMNIGHDHIAASINTLILAYVGAAMPLLLLFQLYPEPWTVTINRGFIAEELVRTLVGSLGLVCAVPITTLTASVLSRWKPPLASPPPETFPESMQ
jgi:uncharacterized membrane protein